MTQRIIKTNLLLTGIIFILSSCNSRKNEENTENNGINEAFLNNIKTEKMVISNHTQALLLTGKVECDPDKIISYVPLISGVINKTYFSLGDKVQKGQPLLDLRSTELSALQSEKISLEAEMKIAERELKASQSMFYDNMISEIELLEKEGKLKQIEAEISRINSDMSLYGADKGNGIFTVHAPMNGYIVHKKASPGSMISPDSDEVFTIANLTTVWIVVNVYASDLLSVSKGMEVEITTLSYPDEVFHGKIDAIPQVFDPEEKVLKARIVMNNSDLKFKPEMFVMVKLKNQAHVNLSESGKQKLPSGLDGALSISSDALIFDDNRYFVVVEETNKEYKIREVTLKGHYEKISYISSGLSEGENVVVKNQLLIYTKLKEE